MRRYEMPDGNVVTTRRVAEHSGTEFVTANAEGDVISSVRQYGDTAEQTTSALRNRQTN